MTTIHLKTPLPEGKRAVLIIMDRVSRLTNLQYFVVGATARDILMYHLHGFPLNRASPDIDFAMAIEAGRRSKRLEPRFFSSRPSVWTRRFCIDFTIRLRLERAFRWIWFRSAVSRVPPRTWRGRRTWQS
jgi:predicted nucleotidyltransferase